MKTLLLFLILMPTIARANSVIEDYPDLKKFVATEKHSDLYFGFGLSPLTIINGRIGLTASLFQLHWMKDNYDIEIFNASFGSSFGGDYGSEQIFTVRAAPKYKVFKNVSVGLLGGAEFVHFPNIKDKLNKGGLYAQPFEFSATGMIYGVVISNAIPLDSTGRDGNFLRVSASLYKETYSALGTKNGWTYYYLDSANPLNTDNSAIAASTVFMLELSYLY